MSIKIAPEGAYTVQASPIFASTVTSYPKYVGGYQMGDIRFNLAHKPSWWHRLGVRVVLGWQWVDTP